ncbi:MAG: ribosomal RNA small subunit methyltransferase A [Calditrichales bacterium]|nr:MAG: ribosomal RNA small subunit methyltransferase A [Calditrichales bacterium]
MAAQIKALKKYGQNFLRDEAAVKKIVNALDCKNEDTIVEIGPGQGALTGSLLAKGCRRLVGVEIDSRLADLLEEKFSSSSLEIIRESILDFSFAEFHSEDKVKVVGNIPYYITSDIIFKILDNRRQIERAVLMVQKEVADRLTAPIRTKDYGILSVFTQMHSRVSRVLDISREKFYPVPNVDSAVVLMEMRDGAEDVDDYPLFKRIVYAGFQNRRKMLRNSLKRLLLELKIDDIEPISMEVRPEELTVAEFIQLTNSIFAKIKI